MLECARAAFACQDALCCPATLEIGAGNAQLVDDATYFWIVGIAGHGGSELGNYTVRAGWPIPYQRPGFGSEEDVSQEVALAIGVEPACEEAGRFCIPATRIPRAIENVSRAIDRVDAGEHGLGWIVAIARTVWIALASKLEKVGSLSPRQAQAAREARKRRRRHRHVAALFD